MLGRDNGNSFVQLLRGNMIEVVVVHVGEHNEIEGGQLLNLDRGIRDPCRTQPIS